MQRARLALPHLRALGWEAVVLAVVPENVEGAVIEPALEQTYPPDIRIVRVRGIPPGVTRPLGFGSLWLRCCTALRSAGERLLRDERFDLVFFTTTQFDVFTLGPRWLARFGVPYVLDYQDPWVNDYYERAGLRPPGGPFKFWLSQFTARRREPAAVRQSAAIVSVSSSYGPDLLARYPDLDPAKIIHLPFGSEPSDLATARDHRPKNPLVPFGDGRRHLVYAGRCGPDMTASLTLLFRAFRRYLSSNPAAAQATRLHFIGTDYAPPPLGRFWAKPIAEAEGVSDFVSEHCYRVPYFDALHYLAHADGVLLVGSTDPTYSASKIFPCLFAHRPLLVLAHEHSLMLELARIHGASAAYGFSTGWQTPQEIEKVVARLHDEWFVQGLDRYPPTIDTQALHPHTAVGMTEILAGVFARSADNKTA
jgi:hypothetical protein